MSINVKNGTPMHGPSLCETCERAHIMKGYRESELVVICHATYEPERTVTFPVRECSGYIRKNVQTLYDMEKIAWTLTPRGPQRAAGFVASGASTSDECEIELVLNDHDDQS